MPQGENAQQARIWIGETTAHSWETLVMTAINFKELKVKPEVIIKENPFGLLLSLDQRSVRLQAVQTSPEGLSVHL